MLLKLEQEVSKLTGLKNILKEMGATLWQRRLRKKVSRIRASNARKWILGWC